MARLALQLFFIQAGPLSGRRRRAQSSSGRLHATQVRRRAEPIGLTGEPRAHWLRLSVRTVVVGQPQTRFGDHLAAQDHHLEYLEDSVSQPDQLPSDEHPSTGIDRRTVIRNGGVLGVGALGAVTLMACGAGAATTTAGGLAAGAGSADLGKTVVKTSDIPVGAGKVFDATKVVVTQPKAGEFKAFSAICTHMGCTVAGVANGTITCPCHGSTYDAATGQVTGGPAPSPLPSRTVTVSGGSITVS